MRRRDFLSVLSGAAASWPLAAHAQKTLPAIGFLNAQSQDDLGFAVAAFRNGLKETGYEEGRNVTVEYYWAEGREDRLATLSADLAKSKVAVIASTGGDLAALALKRAGTTIPTVFAVGGDPVALGLVASLNRPGGNFTGVTQITVQLDPKRLEALHELMPGLGVVAVLRNPANANAKVQVTALQDAARAMNIELQFASAATEQEIDAAFAKLAEQRVGALMVASDPFFNGRHHQILALAAKLAVPAIFHQREFTMEGGLMSYGTRVSESYRRVGIYAGRILKGERVAELPVQQGTNVELVVNLKTAKKLNVAVPQTILARADEIIE
jgi:putative tryptophan/tyrosine transport system substrate-binding protein